MKKKRGPSVKKTRPKITPKKCFFCAEKKEPYFSQVEILRRFVTERGKIIGRTRTGTCAKHQRRVSIAIKHARHLALLPFVGQR